MPLSSPLDSAAIVAALGFTPANNSALAGKVGIDAGFNAVGSFCFAKQFMGSSSAGGTVAGSSLYNSCTLSDGAALSGTWRALSLCAINAMTVFQRIS